MWGGEYQVQKILQDIVTRNARHRTVPQQVPIWAKKEGKEQIACICLKVHQCQPVWEETNKVPTTAEEMEAPFSLNTLFYYLHVFTMFMYYIFQIFTLK